MRGHCRASALGTILLSCSLSCSNAATPHAPRPRDPPPRVLVVGLEQVALRTSAWVELHAWLAAAGRGGRETGDAELDPAAHAYAAVLADDPRDELLGRTTRALASCDDERCARAAVSGTSFAAGYLAALPGFLDRHWAERAAKARAGMEVARAALGEELEPLVASLSRALAIDWPRSPPVVDVVADAPEPGRDAPIRALLAAQGSCFTGARDESERMHDAHIMDCVLVHAVLRLAARSEMALEPRAWTALVVHAVATVVTAWEPRHVSVLRRSAEAVMPEELEWLAREWPSRLRGEPARGFAKRYADHAAGR